MVPGEFKYTGGTIRPVDRIDEDSLKDRSRNLFPACSLARNGLEVRAPLVRGPALTFALSSLRSHQAVVRQLPHAALACVVSLRLRNSRIASAISR